MLKINEITFDTFITSETSFGGANLGKHESTMTLYATREGSHGFIEWDIPALDKFVEIGLWFGVAHRPEGVESTLVDYDGVFALPVLS